MKIDEAVIIVTGASAGIGAELATQLALHGAKLILVGRNEAALDELRQRLHQAESHHVIAGDIGERATSERAVARALTAFGRIDCIICNAGIGLSAPVAQIRINDFQACLETNVYGVLHSIQTVLPVFTKYARGKIVVVSSVVGVRGLPYSGGYCASKGAIERLCDALRVELLGSGISLNVVRPGTVRTQFSTRKIGGSHEVRVRTPAGISAELAAQRIIRGISTNKRFIYTRWRDRLLLWGSELVAPLADRVLARSIVWKKE
ncbi:MAG: SDR family NAD(P)-dependent oxidoreductase [Chloroflexi bacterium]|nr:SDR family NAD(P)-dependent oxidoreductase [Chloroflexota bacterium]